MLYVKSDSGFVDFKNKHRWSLLGILQAQLCVENGLFSRGSEKKVYKLHPNFGG
jgi:hypothetical protein